MFVCCYVIFSSCSREKKKYHRTHTKKKKNWAKVDTDKEITTMLKKQFKLFAWNSVSQCFFLSSLLLCCLSNSSKHAIHFCHILLSYGPTTSSSVSTMKKKKENCNDIFMMWYNGMHTHKIDKQHTTNRIISIISLSFSVTIPLFISIWV